MGPLLVPYPLRWFPTLVADPILVRLFQPNDRVNGHVLCIWLRPRPV